MCSWEDNFDIVIWKIARFSKRKMDRGQQKLQVANALAKCPINCFRKLHQKYTSAADKKLPAFFIPSFFSSRLARC